MEEERVANRLDERQQKGEIARVLGDLRLAGLAFFLEPLERGTAAVISCMMIEAVM